MPDGAGQNQPDPESVDGKPNRVNEGIGKSSTNELTPLERLVAARQAEKRGQRKRDSRVLALLVLVGVLVIGGGVFAWVRLAPPPKHHRASVRAAPSVLATPKASPTAPLRLVTPNGPPSSPFFGSPAYTWADGAAGITIPAARPHGPYTAAAVRSAYETTRQLLIAGNLNWPTLRGGPPTAFEGLLTRQERAQFIAGLKATALTKDGAAENTRGWVSSFAPGSTQFVTTVIKVRGTMSAGLATDAGSEVLRIKLDYLFVFAVEQPGNPANRLRVVQQLWGYVDFAQWDDPGGPLKPWFQVRNQTAGALCGERDGYIHPAYPQAPPPSVRPSGATVSPYSLATPSAASTSGCHPTTGT